MVRERMVSSVMTPPALRITWASPTSSPSTGLLPGNRRAHSSFAASIRSISAMRTSVSPFPSGP
jgi:hypothetical protein